MVRFYSLVPGLKSIQGHEFSYHQAVEESAKLNGYHFQAFIAKDAQVTPPTKGWNFYFKAFFRDCCSLLRKQNEETIFFLESFNLKKLALFTLSLLLFAKKNTQVWILFRYGLPYVYAKGKIHLFLCDLLTYKLKRRFKILTDSEKIADTFRRPVTVMPIPHTKDFISDPAVEKKIFWWPGEPREAKGLKEMQKLAHHREAFLVEIIAAKSSHLPVRLIEDQLSAQDYREWMSKSSVILLPYDEKVYRYSTSGILIEAITAGKMPLVKKGTWLSDVLIKNDLSELVIDFDRPDFFSASLALLADKGVQHKLQTLQKTYKHYHSVENYASCMRALHNSGL